MLIENPEALKEWLTAILEPMCDADPNALAKYVIALVKKDKPISELRDTCLDQLDVFLQLETKPFVELLFKALDSKAYLTKPTNVTLQVAQPTPPGTELPTSVVNNTNSNSTTNSNTNNSNNNSLPNLTATPTPLQIGVSSSSLKTTSGLSATSKVSSDRRSSRPETNVDDRSNADDRDSKRPVRKSGIRSRSRSHSPTWNRNRSRSRSRDRDDRRPRRSYGDDDRRRRGGIGRRYDRYNDYRPDRNRDRIERKRSRTRSRSPKSRTRSRSLSPSRAKDRERMRSDAPRKSRSPHSQDHGDKDYRFSVPNTVTTVTTTRGSSPAVPPAPPGVQSNDSKGSFPAKNPRRCRDYDEKGYCMRGDLCPFDHGADPVVVEEVHLPNMLAYGPGGGPGNAPAGGQHMQGPGPVPRPPGPPPPGAIPPLLGPPMGHPRPIPPPPIHPMPGPRHFPHMPDPFIAEPYNPEAPALDRMPPRMMRPPFWGPRMGPGRGPGLRPPHQFMHAPRELINVPTIDNSNLADLPSANNRTVVPPQKRPLDGAPVAPPPRVFRSVGNMADPMVKRRPFDFNRLGSRNKFNLENAILELRKIPHGLNSITQLNNHFSRFGKIVNLQVCYEGDPEAAIVQFSSHAEAHAAYRSTEAVLNNRFIKVFWHNKDASEASAPQEGGVPPVKKLSAKERLGLPVGNAADGANTTPISEEPEKSAVIMATSGTLSKTLFNPAALKKSNVVANSGGIQTNSANAQVVLSAQETIKKKQEEQRKEAIKIKADLMKREQELYVKQLQHQKLLIEKVEKNKTMTPNERSNIMATVKVLQESIEKLKVGLEAAAQTSHPKTKQEAQKEILDIEMELYSRQHQGADTSELRRKVAELKHEAVSLGLVDRIPVRGRGVLRKMTKVAGVFRGRGRGMGGVRSVDHRPRRLQVSGYGEEDREDVVTHLAQYGEIENIGPEGDKSKLVVTYKTRREAELAAIQGAKYKDRVLAMVWHQGSNVRLSTGDGADGLQDGLTGDDELQEPDGENEDLLLGDDDEEEDSDARSWRR